MVLVNFKLSVQCEACILECFVERSPTHGGPGQSNLSFPCLGPPLTTGHGRRRRNTEFMFYPILDPIIKYRHTTICARTCQKLRSDFRPWISSRPVRSRDTGSSSPARTGTYCRTSSPHTPWLTCRRCSTDNSTHGSAHTARGNTSREGDVSMESAWKEKERGKIRVYVTICTLIT